MINNKIKSVIVLNNDFSSNKTNREELYNSLKKISIRPYIGGIYDGKINDYYKENNITFLPIIASRSNTNPFVELKSIINIKNQIKKERIDAAIIYGVKNHAAMAIGSHLGGCKKIICIVNGSGNLFRIKGIKGKLLRFMAFPMLKIAYRLSSSICFQNEDDMILFKKKHLISKKKDVFVTGGSGVNLEAYPYTNLPKQNRFLFLARITPTKGIKEYIEAARIIKGKYPDCIFDVYGGIDSAVESSLGTIIEAASNEGIINYYGKTNEVAKAIGKSRFFVYPSYYPEGVSRCLLQALSCGRPIITCNTPGCKETVMDGINGFLVDKQDVEQLVDKMGYFINNPQKITKMAKESRRLAEEKFDVNKVNEDIIRRLIDC